LLLNLRKISERPDTLPLLTGQAFGLSISVVSYSDQKKCSVLLHNEQILYLSFEFLSWIQGEGVRILISSSVLEFTLLDFDLSEGVEHSLALLVPDDWVGDLAVGPGR
jgi:hypothetical protein